MPSSIIIDGTAGGAFSDQPGSDQITFGVAAASLTASQGTDTVLGGAGQLVIDASGNSNPISIQGGGGHVVYTGGPGAAAINAGSSPVTVLTGNGAISLVAGGQPLDVYSSDAWSGYYEFTPAAGDSISILFNGSADDVVITDHTTASTVVVGQGFAYNQPDPGTLLPWNEPGVAIVGLTADTHVGSSPDGLTTTDDTPVVMGTAPALSAVTVTTSAGVALSQPVIADSLGEWQAALTQLPYGESDLVAHAAIDPSLPPFEMSDVAALQIVPPSPTIVGFTDGSGLTTGSGATFDLQPEIDGTTQAGTTVQVFNGQTLLGDATVTGTSWAYDPPADLPEGAYALTAVATDPTSGAASVASDPITLAISLAPPTIDGFTDTTGYLTGGDTLDHQPTLSGTMPAGAAVDVYDNGALIGSAVVTGTAWSFTPSTDLTDGAASITAIATDTSTGVSSAASAALVFTVDPSAPSLTELDGASGAYQSGATVADLNLVLSGAADPGTVVTVSDGADVLGQATSSGSTWTYTLPDGLSYGPHALTAVATDPSDGDVSDPSGELDFTFAPPAPVVSGLTPDTDDGSSSTDGVTSDADPVIIGTAVAGDLVSVYDGVTLLGSADADGTGAWQLTPPAALAYGPHVLTATDTAADGSATSVASDPDTIVIVPTAPSVVGFTDGLGPTTGSGATFDLQPEIDGTTQAGTTVQVFDGQTLLGDATVSGASWTYDPPVDLPEGSDTITAVATDPVSGVASAASAPLTLDVSLAAPTADSFTDSTGVETGGATLDHQPTLSGTTPAGAAVGVYENGALIGSAVVTGATWSFTPSVDLADGADSITAVATDPVSGASSAASAALVFTVEPAAPDLTELDGASGAYQSGATVADLGLVLSGTADPNTVVTVSDGADVLGQATSSGSTWTYTLPAGLSYGPHALTAVATDPSDGDVSDPSGELDFTFAPPAPVVSGLTPATDDGSSSTDGVTSDADPVIVGTAVAGDLVSVYDGTTLLGSATADGTGAWQLMPAAALSYGAHVLTATDTAADGAATSLASQATTVTILSPPPLITMFNYLGTGQPLQAWVTPDAAFTLSGTSVAGSTISVYDGSTLVGRSAAVGSDDTWSVQLATSLAAGQHILTATASDPSGHASEPSIALSVIVNPPPGAAAAAAAATDPLATSILTYIKALVGPGVDYLPEPDQPMVVLGGQVSGLSIDDAMSGQSFQVPLGTTFVSDIASGPVTVDGASSGVQAVVVTKGDVTYVAGPEEAVLLTDQSSGDVTLFGSSVSESSIAAATGSGNDVFVIRTGAASLSGGAGDNVFWLDGGSSVVDSSGVDTIIAGAGDETVTGGADTVSAAPHIDLIFGGAGKLDFIGVTGGSTVVAGSGSSTLQGGAGSALFFGGRAGGNVMVAGAAPSTLVGGGGGDLLFAQGTGDDVLVAKGDNTTLDGGNSTGNNLYFGGAGRNVIAAGRGADTIAGGEGSSTIFAGAGRDLVFAAGGGGDIVAGAGNATLAGGKGADLYAFFDGRAGGDVVIYNYRPGVDHLTLKGYTAQSVAKSLQSETVQSGSTHLLLSDGTQITFIGISDFKASNLV